MAEYIEREALVERMGDLHFQNYGTAIMAVLDAPAADVVEVKRGRWVKEFYHPYWCSCCKEVAPIDAEGESHYRSNFCPNCGADMRERADEGIGPYEVTGGAEDG